MAGAPLTATTATEGVDVADIQALAFYAYMEHPFASYLLVQLRKADSRTGAWLRGLVHGAHAPRRAKDAASHPLRNEAESHVQIAFTVDGLAALGIGRAELDEFPREFVDGMSARAKVLGDSPDDWAFGGAGHDEIHALVIVFARTRESLAELVSRHTALVESAGGRVLSADEGHLSKDHREHFGFRDGIAQPHVAHGPRRSRGGEKPLPPGELLLGYPNAYGERTAAPNVRGYNLGQNGTFVVYRKMRQHVAAFWSAIRSRARPLPGESQDEAAVRLAASLVGRWPSGAPLVLYPNRDSDSAANQNDFKFAQEDAEGQLCPFGAHIRRANPRDMLAPNPKQSLLETGRHRLFRRGRSYGPRLLAPHPATPVVTVDDGVDRGLLFLGLCSSLRRQFEFIQQTWVNNRKFAGLYDESDPLIGPSSAGDHRFTLQRSPVRRCLVDLPAFTTVRGGAYFFMPGLRALEWLADQCVSP